MIPLRPLGLGDVLAGSFTVFRRNPRVLLLWGLLLSGVLGLVSTLVTTFARTGLQQRLDSVASGSSSDAGVISAGTVTLWLLVSVAVPFLVWLGRGFLVAPVATDTGQRVLGRRGTFGGLWSLLAGRRLAVVRWMLVQLGAGVVLGGAVAGVLFLVVGATVGAGGTAAIVTFVLTLFAVFLAVGVVVAWLATRFAFTVPTIALEGRGAFGAAAQSWRLTRGAFWRTFGILLLVRFVFTSAVGIAATPLTIATALVSGVFDPLDQTGAASGGFPPAAVVAVVVGALLSIAVQTITDVLGASVTTFLAIDRRIRTEALDQRIASHLETGQPADPFAPAVPWTPGPGPWSAPPQQWPQQQQWRWQQPHGQQPQQAPPGQPQQAPPGQPWQGQPWQGPPPGGPR